MTLLVRAKLQIFTHMYSILMNGYQISYFRIHTRKFIDKTILTKNYTHLSIWQKIIIIHK